VSSLFSHGPQGLARVAVRYLAIALAICIVPKLVAAGAAPLLQALAPLLVLMLLWAFLRSRMHL
jgi:hypothetical protein